MMFVLLHSDTVVCMSVFFTFAPVYLHIDQVCCGLQASQQL